MHNIQKLLTRHLLIASEVIAYAKNNNINVEHKTLGHATISSVLHRMGEEAILHLDMQKFPTFIEKLTEVVNESIAADADAPPFVIETLRNLYTTHPVASDAPVHQDFSGQIAQKQHSTPENLRSASRTGDQTQNQKGTWIVLTSPKGRVTVMRYDFVSHNTHNELRGLDFTDVLLINLSLKQLKLQRRELHQTLVNAMLRHSGEFLEL